MTAPRRFSWRSIGRALLGCLEGLGYMALAEQGFSQAPGVLPEDAPQGPPPGHPEALCGRPMDEVERRLWRELGEWGESH